MHHSEALVASSTARHGFFSGQSSAQTASTADEDIADGAKLTRDLRLTSKPFVLHLTF